MEDSATTIAAGDGVYSADPQVSLLASYGRPMGIGSDPLNA
jgi:hypothetical protein